MNAVKINITLPAKTAEKLKKRVKPRERSQVIAEALELYFKNISKEKLVRELIEAYSYRADGKIDDHELWDSTLNDGLDDETW